MLLNNGPLLTVLLCARNEEQYIVNSLESLARQDTCTPYEIVVIDNDSIDRTTEIALTFTPNVFKCRQRGKIPSLKEGLRHCLGEVIAIADADTIYPSNWLSSIDSLFRSSVGCQLVFGSSDMGFGSGTLAGLASYISSAFVLISFELNIVCSLGFNMAVRRKVLQEVLEKIESVALSGWGIGTAILKLYGREAVVYSRNLQVPKCMRRYKNRGFFATCSIWGTEWVRLSMGHGLKIKEFDYYL